MDKEEIIQKANEVLEETKSEQSKYLTIRQLIFALLEKINKQEENIDILEKILQLYFNMKVLVNDSKKYQEAKLIVDRIDRQNIRKDDNVSKIIIFEIDDKKEEVYEFFSRNTANNYKKNNAEKFEDTADIKVKNNRNIDLNNLISIFEE